MKPPHRILKVVFLFAAVAFIWQCSSTGGYKAQSLSVFTPPRAAHVDGPGFVVLAGRLADEGAAVRVLGPRSRKLASAANIVQLSVASTNAFVRLSPDSITLRLPSGELLQPLSPHQVLAAVSVPPDYWAEVNPTRPTPHPYPRDLVHTGSEDAIGAVTAAIALGIAGLDSATAKADARRYKKGASADVVEKTTVARTVQPGTTASLLVVFLPSGGKVPDETSFDLVVEAGVDGETWRKIVTVPALPSHD